MFRNCYIPVCAKDFYQIFMFNYNISIFLSVQCILFLKKNYEST